MGEARSFIDEYFKRYKKIKKYLDSLVEKARQEGYVTTVLGRRAYFPEIKSSNATRRQFAERAAMNAPLQGSAADLIKIAMIRIQEALEKKKLDAKMILQVHDELVFDVSENDCKNTGSLIEKNMENALELDVQLKVGITISDSWYK